MAHLVAAVAASADDNEAEAVLLLPSPSPSPADAAPAFGEAGRLEALYSLSPKMALPTRTLVLPCWMARPKSPDMPMDSSSDDGSRLSACATAARTATRRSKYSDATSPSLPAAGKERDGAEAQNSRK